MKREGPTERVLVFRNALTKASLLLSFSVSLSLSRLVRRGRKLCWGLRFASVSRREGVTQPDLRRREAGAGKSQLHQ